MKIYIYLLFSITLLTLSSCDDYVDIQPRGEKIALTLDDVELLLNQGRTLSDLTDQSSNHIPVIVNDNLRANDDDIQAMNELSNVAPFNRFTTDIFLLKSEFYRETEVDGHWGGSYRIIGICNYVLELLSEIEPETPEEMDLKDQYTAEALIHRAFYYFRLVNIYGPHYGLNEASQEGLGVPIILEFGDNEVPINRKSVNDVYDLMVSDLELAISLASEVTPNVNRPRKAGAFGLLARVYLHMGNYDLARQNSESALALYSDLYDYNTLVGTSRPTQLNNVEHVLLKQVLPAFTRNITFGSNYFFNRFSNELTALYETEDLRLNELTLLDGTYTFGGSDFTIFSKYISVGITTPELMLIQAESMARLGDFTEAINVVNQLRETRYPTASVTVGDHELMANSQEEAVSHIIDERRREFHVSGMRFFDIKRLNAIEGANISLTRSGVTLSPNSINWAMPIGFDVIANSDGQITQNPRE